MNQNLPKSVDEMKDILDIEGIFFSSLPDTLRLIIIIVLILIALSLFFIIAKKISKLLAKRGEELLSPEERALRYLAGLKKKKMIEQKQWRPFYFLLDEIFRRYLFEKFSFDVLDKTFEELKIQMDMFSKHLLRNEIVILNQFWARAQMAKFAGQSATPDDAENDYGFVKDLVERTKNVEANDKIKLS